MSDTPIDLNKIINLEKLSKPYDIDRLISKIHETFTGKMLDFGYTVFLDTHRELLKKTFVNKNESVKLEDLENIINQSLDLEDKIFDQHYLFLYNISVTAEQFLPREDRQYEVIAYISEKAHESFGDRIGSQIANYYENYIINILPLAKNYIVEQKFNENNYLKFMQLYGLGKDIEKKSLGKQFGCACADYVTKGILSKGLIDLENVRNLILNYGKSIVHLNEDEFEYCIEHLKNKILNGIPSYTMLTPYGKSIDNDILLIMSATMETPGLTNDKINIILNSLLTINKTNILPLAKKEKEISEVLLSARDKAKKHWKMD